MEVTTISIRKKIVEYTTKKLKVGSFIVTEKYENGKLTSQKWSHPEGLYKLFPDAYEPKRLQFSYYENNSFVTSDLCTNLIEYADSIPKASLIHDWDSFKGFDHVICIWTAMDGNIYQIDKPTPIPTWRKQDYIGSFYERDFPNLEGIVKELEKLNFIRNIEVVEIPYYNQYYEGEKGVEFEYKLPYTIMNHSYDISNKDVRKIAEKYRKIY